MKDGSFKQKIRSRAVKRSQREKKGEDNKGKKRSMAGKYPCCSGDPTKSVEESHERKLIKEESKAENSEEAVKQMNDIKMELLGKMSELKDLIQQTRCQCTHQPVSIDQINELKEMIRDGGCNCPKDQQA